MSFQNPLAFVKRKEILLTIGGETVTGYAIDLEELEAIGDRFPWFGKQMKGQKVDMDAVAKSDMLRAANTMIAASLAPDASDAERQVVENSARNIDAEERGGLMRTIMIGSFPKIAAVLDEDAEGNVKADLTKANRQQRRAVRSKDGGKKPRT